MPTTVPFLWFDGQAEQAAALNVPLFPDSEVLSTTRFGPDVPGGVDGNVMTVSYRLGTQQWVALNGGPQYSSTEAVCFQIPCADEDEAQAVLGMDRLDVAALRAAADAA